jgi:ferredoxin
MGVHFNESPNDMECISCMSCSKVCKQNAIKLEIGKLPITDSSQEPKSNPI